MSTPKQIQKQLAREKAHADHMSPPDGLIIYRFCMREMKRFYVKSINTDTDNFFEGVEYTEDKSESLVHPTYDSARYGVAGLDHLEYLNGFYNFRITKA